MKKTTHIILLFLFCMATLSCEQKKSVFIENSNCIQPCWRRIRPGMSKEGVINIIKSMEDIDQNSIKWNLPHGNSFDSGISWKFINRQEMGGGLTFKDDSLTNISLGYVNELPIDDFIKEFGEPTEVLIYSTISGRQSYSQTYILYIEKGICLTHNTSLMIETSAYKITSTRIIQNISWVDPQFDPYQFVNGCLQGFDKSKLEMDLQKWVGYGNYSVLKQ